MSKVNGKEQQPHDLPVGWVWATLEDAVDILDNRRIPVNAAERDVRIEGKHQGDLVPYYGATGQVGWIDSHLFDEELVLLGEDGAPFLDTVRDKAYMIRGKSWVNNHAHVLRARQSVASNGWMCHYLNSFDYHEYVTGTTRLKLNQGRMKRIPVPVAPLPEQHRIVAEIETQFTRLDAGVAALKRVQANLRRYKASVLKAACEGRLVPTEAELARQEGRDYETADVLLQRILTERRARWETENPKKKYKEPATPDTDDLPELPEGWVWATVEQLGEVIGGLTMNQKRKTHELRLPYLRVANVYANELRLDDLQTVGVKEDELERLLLRKDDLLVVEGNGSLEQIGRVAIWSGAVEPCVHQNHIIKVRFHLANLSSFALFWLLSEGGRDQITLVASSTSGLYTLSLSKVSALLLPVPPLVEQARIVDEVERRLSVVQELEVTVEANLKRAERLRQSILKMAFEGKLVPQASSDEPATELLESIKTELAKRKFKQNAAPRKPQEKHMASTEGQRRGIYEILSLSESPLKPEIVFRQTGLAADQVEEFYQELWSEVDKRVRVLRPNNTDVYLEAIKS